MVHAFWAILKITGGFSPFQYDASVMAVSKVEESEGYVWDVDLKERRERGTSIKGMGVLMKGQLL